MKTYIKINLNKAESSEIVKERMLERTRWVMFGILVFSFFLVSLKSDHSANSSPESSSMKYSSTSLVEFSA